MNWLVLTMLGVACAGPDIAQVLKYNFTVCNYISFQHSVLCLARYARRLVWAELVGLGSTYHRCSRKNPGLHAKLIISEIYLTV